MELPNQFINENPEDIRIYHFVEELVGSFKNYIDEEFVDEDISLVELPLMVENNTSTYGTGFTITIEAAEGVTTGVSAADRVKTVKAASNPDAKPSDLHHPGHVFPLRAREGGVLERDGPSMVTVIL